MTIPATAPAAAGSQSYDALTQAIHWLSLIVIAVAFAAGWIMEDMPRGPAKMQWVNLHASMGVVLMLLTLARLAWRRAATAPQPLPGSPLLHVAAKAMQGVLYTVMIAIPLSGVVMMAAKGRSFEVFGLIKIPPLMATNRELGGTFEELHEFLANSMLVLVGLHAAAAVFHQAVLRDGALARMLPFGRASRA